MAAHMQLATYVVHGCVNVCQKRHSSTYVPIPSAYFRFSLSAPRSILLASPSFFRAFHFRASIPPSSVLLCTCIHSSTSSFPRFFYRSIPFVNPRGPSSSEPTG